ncbi:hypothetical protein V7087_24760 [Neobacillus niacini]|uniref:hypothetical protein n=1 Tax=Neobacillus niacini TaxID=86668 RepID=UPI003000F0EE
MATFNQKIPFSITVFNPCDGGEFVDLTGVAHVVSHVSTDNNGGFHVVSHFNTQALEGKGSLTGTRYVGRMSDTLSSNAKPPFPNEFTAESSFTLISLGQAPNFQVHTTIHLTVNANGVPTAAFAHFDSSCRG